jgi:hypothetical protein
MIITAQMFRSGARVGGAFALVVATERREDAVCEEVMCQKMGLVKDASNEL